VGASARRRSSGRHAGPGPSAENVGAWHGSRGSATDRRRTKLPPRRATRGSPRVFSGWGLVRFFLFFESAAVSGKGPHGLPCRSLDEPWKGEFGA
jgi:hypothetical protein